MALTGAKTTDTKTDKHYNNIDNNVKQHATLSQNNCSSENTTTHKTITKQSCDMQQYKRESLRVKVPEGRGEGRRPGGPKVINRP